MANGNFFQLPKMDPVLFASIRRGIAAPEEYRNNHLRYQLVHFLCEKADFMVTVLDLHLSANYGMDRLSKEAFTKAEKEGTITKEQKEAQSLPGPFSYVGIFWKTYWMSPSGEIMVCCCLFP